MTTKPRDVIQFQSGPKKGMFAQIISADGKCLTRDMDGSQYAFNPGPEDTFIVVGVAALGPKVDELPGSLPAVPPTPEEIQKLLEPLPPEVKAVPMETFPREAPAPQHLIEGRRRVSRIKPPKPKAEPYNGAMLPYIFRVKNGLGDEAEVEIAIRADWKPSRYTGPAIMRATKLIPAAKPYQVTSRAK